MSFNEFTALSRIAIEKLRNPTSFQLCSSSSLEYTRHLNAILAQQNKLHRGSSLTEIEPLQELYLELIKHKKEQNSLQSKRKPPNIAFGVNKLMRNEVIIETEYPADIALLQVLGFAKGATPISEAIYTIGFALKKLVIKYEQRKNLEDYETFKETVKRLVLNGGKRNPPIWLLNLQKEWRICINVQMELLKLQEKERSLDNKATDYFEQQQKIRSQTAEVLEKYITLCDACADDFFSFQPRIYYKLKTAITQIREKLFLNSNEIYTADDQLDYTYKHLSGNKYSYMSMMHNSEDGSLENILYCIQRSLGSEENTEFNNLLLKSSEVRKSIYSSSEPIRTAKEVFFWITSFRFVGTTRVFFESVLWMGIDIYDSFSSYLKKEAIHFLRMHTNSRYNPYASLVEKKSKTILSLNSIKEEALQEATLVYPPFKKTTVHNSFLYQISQKIREYVEAIRNAKERNPLGTAMAYTIGGYIYSLVPHVFKRVYLTAASQTEKIIGARLIATLKHTNSSLQHLLDASVYYRTYAISWTAYNLLAAVLPGGDSINSLLKYKGESAYVYKIIIAAILSMDPGKVDSTNILGEAGRAQREKYYYELGLNKEDITVLEQILVELDKNTKIDTNQNFNFISSILILPLKFSLPIIRLCSAPIAAMLYGKSPIRAIINEIIKTKEEIKKVLRLFTNIIFDFLKLSLSIPTAIVSIISNVTINLLLIKPVGTLSKLFLIIRFKKASNILHRLANFIILAKHGVKITLSSIFRATIVTRVQKLQYLFDQKLSSTSTAISDEKLEEINNLYLNDPKIKKNIESAYKTTAHIEAKHKKMARLRTALRDIHNENSHLLSATARKSQEFSRQPSRIVRNITASRKPDL